MNSGIDAARADHPSAKNSNRTRIEGIGRPCTNSGARVKEPPPIRHGALSPGIDDRIGGGFDPRALNFLLV
jgi:hypothetical protein